MSWSIEEAILYYKKQGAPADQSALVNLLREVQNESGGSIPAWAAARIAGDYGVKETFLQAIIWRIPGLRIGDVHCMELCAGPNCGKHTALASLANELQQTAACKFTVKCALYAPLRQGAKPQMGWKALSPGRRGAAAGADLGKIREYHTNRNRERTEKGSVPCFLYPQRRSFSAPKQTKGRSKLKETTFLVNISKKRSVKLAVWTWQKGIDFCANG